MHRIDSLSTGAPLPPAPRSGHTGCTEARTSNCFMCVRPLVDACMVSHGLSVRVLYILLVHVGVLYSSELTNRPGCRRALCHVPPL